MVETVGVATTQVPERDRGIRYSEELAEQARRWTAERPKSPVDRRPGPRERSAVVQFDQD
jgi:hypothetical protein